MEKIGEVEDKVDKLVDENHKLKEKIYKFNEKGDRLEGMLKELMIKDKKIVIETGNENKVHEEKEPKKPEDLSESKTINPSNTASTSPLKIGEKYSQVASEEQKLNIQKEHADTQAILKPEVVPKKM